MRNDVPAKAASVPSARSSSIGWPHDSWTWRASWLPARMTVVRTSRGQGFAVSSATASSAIRGAWADEVLAEDELPAAGVLVARPGIGVRAALHLAVADRLRFDPAAGLDQRLIDPRALAGGEVLRLPPRLERRARGAEPGDRAHGLVRPEEESTRSPTGTANGSMSTGVRYVAVTGATGARRTSASLTSAEARAMATAWAATRSASAAVRTWEAANPQAPSAMARTDSPTAS